MSGLKVRSVQWNIGTDEGDLTTATQNQTMESILRPRFETEKINDTEHRVLQAQSPEIRMMLHVSSPRLPLVDSASIYAPDGQYTNENGNRKPR